MMAKIKKPLAMLLIFSFLMMVMPVSVLASEVSSLPNQGLTQNQSISNATKTDSISNDSSIVEPQGFPRFLAKIAIQGISSALKAGANNYWVRYAITNYFDSATAKVFTNSLSRIASVLDDCIAVEEFATAYIKNQIYTAIYSVSGNYGISIAIADGVVALITIFV